MMYLSAKVLSQACDSHTDNICIISSLFLLIYQQLNDLNKPKLIQKCVVLITNLTKIRFVALIFILKYIKYIIILSMKCIITVCWIQPQQISKPHLSAGVNGSLFVQFDPTGGTNNWPWSSTAQMNRFYFAAATAVKWSRN